eukprot:184513-Hanusia_phi.AAC.1
MGRAGQPSTVPDSRAVEPRIPFEIAPAMEQTPFRDRTCSREQLLRHEQRFYTDFILVLEILSFDLSRTPPHGEYPPDEHVEKWVGVVQLVRLVLAPVQSPGLAQPLGCPAGIVLCLKRPLFEQYPEHIPFRSTALA